MEQVHPLDVFASLPPFFSVEISKYGLLTQVDLKTEHLSFPLVSNLTINQTTVNYAVFLALLTTLYCNSSILVGSV